MNLIRALMLKKKKPIEITTHAGNYVASPNPKRRKGLSDWIHPNRRYNVYQLFQASREGDLEYVKMYRGDVNEVVPDYATAICQAVACNQIEVIAELLRHGADPTLRAGPNENAVFCAVESRNYQALSMFVNFSFDEVNGSGQVPLDGSSLAEMTKVLIQLGANPNIDRPRNHPLSLLAGWNYMDVNMAEALCRSAWEMGFEFDLCKQNCWGGRLVGFGIGSKLLTREWVLLKSSVDTSDQWLPGQFGSWRRPGQRGPPPAGAGAGAAGEDDDSYYYDDDSQWDGSWSGSENGWRPEWPESWRQPGAPHWPAGEGPAGGPYSDDDEEYEPEAGPSGSGEGVAECGGEGPAEGEGDEREGQGERA